jgi:RNA polymerase sigma-70 factor (ECF subfamily)
VSISINEEIELLSRFRNGDTAAFEELVRENEDRIYNLCLSMLGNSLNAQDAAQDTFIKAYRGHKEFHPEASFSTWLYRIAINTCLDYRKKSRHDPLTGESLSEYLKTSDPSPEGRYHSKRAAEALQTALKLLPDKLRSAIVLKEIECLSYEEIAIVLDISIGTVKSRISRARDELRNLFQVN